MYSEKECLVIMPFGSTKDEELFYDMVYSHIIIPAFQEASISASRIDREVVGEEPLPAAIEKRLRTAPLVIADLSNNNPNVLYELGFRRAQGKPFIGISRSPGDAAFWPKNFLLIDYTASNAVNKISKAIRKKYEEVQVRLEVEDELTDLTEKVRTKGTFNNPFQDRLAAWRLRRAREQVGMIQESEAEFEAKTSTAYVAHLFQGIMGVLKDGDEYWTVTNMDFWSDKAVGDSPFLDANVKAARKGAKISRVFIIDKSRLNNSSVLDDLEVVLHKHKEACNRVDVDRPGNMIVRCLLSENFNKDRARHGHFGLARASNSEDTGNWGSVVIAPRYDSSLPGVAISHLKLIFWTDPSSDLEIMKYVHMFEGAFGAKASEDLDTFLKRICKLRGREKGV